MTFGSQPVYCNTCRQALNVMERSGRVDFLHKDEVGGSSVAHRAVPVLLSQIKDPLMECDFCSSQNPIWLYRCEDREIEHFRETKRVYDADQYREKHTAATTLRTEGSYDYVTHMGEGWAACDECAKLIEAENLVKLVTRVTESMPPKLTRGKRLLSARGRLYSMYEHFFQTKNPGREQLRGGNDEKDHS